MIKRSDDDNDRFLWERVKDSISPLPNRKEVKITRPAQTKKIKPAQITKPATRRDKPLKQNFPVSKHKSVKAVTPAPQDLSGHKRVRRGRIESQSRIDLHGKTHDEAKAELLAQLQNCAQRGVRVVLVITGRGERDQGVLRTGLARWLNDPAFSELVSGYAPAHPRHGGKGAWYVFVRKNE